MPRWAMTVLLLSALAVASAPASAQEKTIEGSASEEASEDGGDAAEDSGYTVVTGLDFAMWWQGDLRLAGPGLALGFVLIPDGLEMTMSFGAMLGSHVCSIPIELTFAVPFQVTRWLNMYVDFGPTLMLDKADGEMLHDWAVSVGAGFEALPPGFDWGIYAEGDFNLRVMRKLDNQGGFSIGFRYRF